MVRNVLQHITDIHIFPVISLFLFIAVFGLVLYTVVGMRKPHVQNMSGLPLLDDEETPNASGE